MNRSPQLLHQTMDYRGYKIAYSVYGHGDPVICLHGLNLNKSMFAGKNIKELFRDKMIIALDLPGYGKSDFIPEAGIEEIIAVITRTAKELHLNRFELCGYCLGGIFALDYAIRHQSRVTRLYLIETMIYLPWWLKVCSTALYSVLYRKLHQNSYYLSVLSLIPALSGLVKMQSLKLTPQVWSNPVNSFYINMMKQYQKIDHLQRSRNLSCETKLIFSARSFQNVQRTNRELHAAIKNSTLHKIKAEGHFSLIFSLSEFL